MNTTANIVTTPPALCTEHPHCLLTACHYLWCHNAVHYNLTGPGQPRRYCSTRCRVAEHRRLHQ